jgi:hypothetical protein
LKAATFLEPDAHSALRISQNPRGLFKVTSKTKEAVTWQHLYAAIAGFSGLLLTGFVFFYAYMLPDKISSSISSSSYLKEKFDANQKSLDKINDRLTKIGVEDLSSLMLPLKNPALIFESLKEITSGDPTSLVTTLPEARKLLPILRDSKGKIPERAYQKVSEPLLRKYPRATGSLKQEIWSTFVALATTKSVTDARISPPSESELARARNDGNLIEGGSVDLSQKETWQNTIFKDCKITVSNPKQTLNLSRVRFMDVDFQSTQQNQAGENLVAAMVTNDSPEITKSVVEFKVKINVLVPCCLKPETKSDSAVLSRPSQGFLAVRH